MLSIPLILLASACYRLQKTEAIPSFDMLLIDSVTHITTDNMKKGKPIALLYFNPDCEHCQEETESLLKNMDSLKNVRFYFISNDSLDRLRVFNTYYQIYNYPNIVIAQDYAFAFPKYFKSAAPPYLVIYDEDKRLRALLPGGAKPRELIDFIKKL